MSRNRARAALTVLLALHVVFVLRTHGNFDHDHDSQYYARLAHDITRGEFELAHHAFNNRFGVTVPAAISYRLLGVGRYSTLLWPLLASLATIAITAGCAARLGGAGAALLAAFLLAVNPAQVEFASRLLPDVPVALCLLASFACAAAGRAARSPGRQGALGAGCALALCAGVFVKASAVLGAPFLLGLGAWDLAHRRSVRFWLAAAAAGVATAAVTLAAYGLLTGDPLYRLHGIEATHNVRPWSFSERDEVDLLVRLTYEPLAVMLANPALGIPLALAAPAVLHLVFGLAFLPAGTRSWSGAFAVLLLMFWFGSTSLEAYNPLVVAPRYLLPLLPLLAILAAATWTALAAGPSRRGGERLAPRAVAAVALAGLAVTSWRAEWLAALPYAACVLVAAAAAGRPELASSLCRRAPARRGLAAAMVAAAVLYYAPKERLAEVRPLMRIERDMVDRLLRHPPSPTVVFTDRQSAFVLPFYFTPGLPPQLRIVDWADPEAALADESARHLVYVHLPRLNALALNWGDPMPRFVESPGDWILLHEERPSPEEDPAIRVYEAPTAREVLSAR